MLRASMACPLTSAHGCNTTMLALNRSTGEDYVKETAYPKLEKILLRRAPSPTQVRTPVYATHSPWSRSGILPSTTKSQSPNWLTTRQPSGTLLTPWHHLV